VSGTHFGASVTPLRILGLGLVFIFMTNGLSSVCLARGHTNSLFKMSLIGLVLNVVLNIITIPTFGIKGAASATLVCEVLSMFIMMYLVSTQVKVRPNLLRAMSRPLGAGVVTCAVLAPIFVRHGLSTGVGLALIPGVCVVYAVALAALRGVPAEIRTAVTSLRRSS
jgi:O-antigen/teichoic acid export membrane protein